MTAADEIQHFFRKHKDQIWIFCSTFLIGFLMHFYMFSNKMINYFEMNNILTPMAMDKGDTLAMGRWFLPVVSKLSSSEYLLSLLNYSPAGASFTVK